MPNPKITYYVTTLSRYVLVECETETDARNIGLDRLRQLYRDERHPNAGSLDTDSVLVIRPATDAEIDLWQFHQRMLRENATPLCKPGDRVRLVRMADDPNPIPPGQRGTVVASHSHGDWTQVDVDWDNGRSLMLSIPPDEIAIDATEAEQ